MDNRLEKTLQGDDWLGHPMHPALVALPIGMWTFGVVMDMVATVTRNKCIQEAADHAVTAGLVSAGLAAIAGLGEYGRVPDDEIAKQNALTHATLNVSVVGLSSINAVLRNGRRSAGKPGGFIPKLLSLVGMGIVGYSGWLGGSLVYRHATAVDTGRREQDRQKKYQASESSRALSESRAKERQAV